jgi:hypothetical protein
MRVSTLTKYLRELRLAGYIDVSSSINTPLPDTSISSGGRTNALPPSPTSNLASHHPNAPRPPTRSPPNLKDRLANLKKHNAAWRSLTPYSKGVLKIPGGFGAYELQGGIFGYSPVQDGVPFTGLGRDVDREAEIEKAQLKFVVLASLLKATKEKAGVDLKGKSRENDKQMRGEDPLFEPSSSPREQDSDDIPKADPKPKESDKGKKPITWTIPLRGIDVLDFTFNTEMDLLVVMERDRGSYAYLSDHFLL